MLTVMIGLSGRAVTFSTTNLIYPGSNPINMNVLLFYLPHISANTVGQKIFKHNKYISVRNCVVRLRAILSVLSEISCAHFMAIHFQIA